MTSALVNHPLDGFRLFKFVFSCIVGALSTGYFHFFIILFPLQVGDAIWAEFNESEDHIVPYPKGAEDSTLVSVGDHKNNDEDTVSIAGTTEHSAGDRTELQGMEKQHANQTSAHFSATRLDMESWAVIPSLNPALDRNYSDDNIASTYLDFSAEPSLQKVTGNATGLLLLSAFCIANVYYVSALIWKLLVK